MGPSLPAAEEHSIQERGQRSGARVGKQMFRRDQVPCDWCSGGQKAAQHWGERPREARAPDVPPRGVLRAASGRAGPSPQSRHPRGPT